MKLKLGVLLSVAVLVSCGEGVRKDSQLSHDHAKPTRSDAAYQWIDMTKAEFEGLNKDILPAGRSLPVSHKLVKKVQSIIDRIDSNLRSKYPDQLAMTPKPKARVVVDKSVNAFVFIGFGCYDVAASIRGKHKGKAKAVFLDLTGSGEIDTWETSSKSPYKCKKIKDLSILASAVDAFNAKGQYCKVDLTPEGISFSKDCKNSAGVSSASKVVMLHTANFITIHTGIFKAMKDEGSFEAVVAHELGHYYRSHSTADEKKDYWYYYTVGKKNVAYKPKADPNLEKQGKMARVASLILQNDDIFKEIKGQAYTPRVYIAAGDVADQVCKTKKSSCSDSCKEVSNLVSDSDYRKAMRYYPFTPTIDNNEAYFAKYDEAIQKCMESLSYGTKGVVTKRMLTQAILSPEWFGVQDGSDYFPPQFFDYIREQFKTVYQRLGRLPLSGGAVSDVLLGISKTFKDDLDLAKDIITEARENRLGQYTTEQEADEEAVEWLTDIGTDPSAAVRSFLTLADGTPDRMDGGLLGGRTCAKLAANDWKDQNGDDIFVPVGDYSEVHHSSCYRAFNAAREIEAHGYKVKKKTGTSLIPWKHMRRLSKSLERNVLTLSPRQEKRRQKNLKKFRRYLGDKTPIDTCPYSSSAFSF